MFLTSLSLWDRGGWGPSFHRQLFSQYRDMLFVITVTMQNLLGGIKPDKFHIPATPELVDTLTRLLKTEWGGVKFHLLYIGGRTASPLNPS